MVAGLAALTWRSRCAAESHRRRRNAASGDEQPVTLPAGRKIVVYAGTLEPYQGVDILVKSFAKVFAAEPDAERLFRSCGKATLIPFNRDFERFLTLQSKRLFCL